MRITNQMTTNNLLLNLNRTTQKLDRLQTQVSTGKKIQHASEDPIIAALALKFRTNVAETKQYTANVKQAKSWLEATEEGIGNANDIVQKIRELCVQGASETYNIDDRKDLSQAISELSKQLISESNVSYAGRYVFGGYKTDQEVIFSKDNTDKYNITQSFTKDSVETIKAAIPVTGNDVKEVKEVDRIQLAYKGATNLDITLSDGQIINFPTPVLPAVKATTVASTAVAIPLLTSAIDKTTTLSTEEDAYLVGDYEVKYVADTGEILIGSKALELFKTPGNYSANYDKDGFEAGDLNPQQYFDCGKYQTEGATIKNDKVILSNVLTAITDIDTINITYTDAALNPITLTTPAITVGTSTDGYVMGANDVRYLSDTGEILFGSAVQANMATPSDLDVAYTKDFGTPTAVSYSNALPLSATLENNFEKQKNAIEYEFGVNNKMQINVEGSDVFTTGLIQDLRDIISTIQSLDIRTEDQIKDDLKAEDPVAYAALTAEELATKVKDMQTGEEQTYRAVMSARLDAALTKIDKHQNVSSTMEAGIGSRVNRLELIENRLGDDKVNYTDLMNSNENIDYESAYIEYMSQQTIYNSALQIGAQVMQHTLVDYVN